MTNFLKGALVGAVAFGGLAITSTDSYAMPVGDMAPLAATESGQHVSIDKVYYRYGWGWRRPFYGHYGWRYGWRRPLVRYGWGWRRPFYHYGYRRFRRW